MRGRPKAETAAIVPSAIRRWIVFVEKRSVFAASSMV
jgi:hypothetical protein